MTGRAVPTECTGSTTPTLGFLAIDSSLGYYFLVWIVVAITIVALQRLQRSRIGRAWNCIREDEVAAQATGINVRSHKLLAFVLGAALAGVAGSLYATKLLVVSPASFTFWDSCLMFSIVLIGGMGSIPGVDHRRRGHHALSPSCFVRS